MAKKTGSISSIFNPKWTVLLVPSLIAASSLCLTQRGSHTVPISTLALTEETTKPVIQAVTVGLTASAALEVAQSPCVDTTISDEIISNTQADTTISDEIISNTQADTTISDELISNTQADTTISNELISNSRRRRHLGENSLLPKFLANFFSGSEPTLPSPQLKIAQAE